MKLHYNPNLKTIGGNLRKAGNLAEVLLWKELRAKKLGVQFLRQRPIGNYVVDFYCHRLNLVIEIDGVSHDSKTEGDETRQKVLESRGVRFLRFADSEVRYNLDSVLREIKEFIKSSVLADSATSFRKGGIRPETMILYKCDICKKAIKEKDETISVGFGGFMNMHNFCKKCAKPVADFLNRHGFGTDKKQKL